MCTHVRDKMLKVFCYLLGQLAAQNLGNVEKFTLSSLS